MEKILYIKSESGSKSEIILTLTHLGASIKCEPNPEEVDEGIYYIDKNWNIIFSIMNSAESKLILDFGCEVEIFNHSFKPFDKILVRDNEDEKWEPQLFAKYCNSIASEYKYNCISGDYYRQALPYEGNEHLVESIQIN